MKPKRRFRWVGTALFLAVAALIAVLLVRGPVGILVERQGLSLLRSREFRQASAVLRLAAAMRPGSVDAWTGYGAALDRLGRHGNALDAFRKAESADPSDPRPPIAEARVLVSLGRHREAYAAYARIARIHPESSEPIESLADLAVRLDRFDDAVEFLVRERCRGGVTTECRKAACLELARRLFGMDRLSEAAVWYRAAAAEDPTDPEPLLQAGYVLNQAGEYAEASDALRGALGRDSDCVRAACELAWSMDHMGNTGAADEIYAAAVEEFPEEVACLWGYSVFLEHQGRLEEAREMLRKLISNPAVSPEARDLGSAGLTDLTAKIAEVSAIPAAEAPAAPASPGP